MFTVRIYGQDPSVQGEALLEEHEFTSESEARVFTWTCATSDSGVRVTFAAAGGAEQDVARYAVKSTVHDWTWTYSGITARDAQQIADELSRHGEPWTAEPIR